MAITKEELYAIKDGETGAVVASGLKGNFDKVVDTINGDLKASAVRFTDGQTFQQKLDAGTLKGDKGDTGAQGPAGAKGDTGAKITSIELTITGGTITGTAHLDDESTASITGTYSAS